MKQLPLGYCGLDCKKCPVFVAKKNNDDALREKTAREFTSLYSEYMGGRTIKPEDVNCNGCQATGGFFIGCTTCVIRKCAQKKKLATCAKCAEYLTCDMLNGFYSQPQNQPARDNLNKMRNNS